MTNEPDAADGVIELGLVSQETQGGIEHLIEEKDPMS